MVGRSVRTRHLLLRTPTSWPTRVHDVHDYADTQDRRCDRPDHDLYRLAAVAPIAIIGPSRRMPRPGDLIAAFDIVSHPRSKRCLRVVLIVWSALCGRGPQSQLRDRGVVTPVWDIGGGPRSPPLNIEGGVASPRADGSPCGPNPTAVCRSPGSPHAPARRPQRRHSSPWDRLNRCSGRRRRPSGRRAGPAS